MTVQFIVLFTLGVFLVVFLVCLAYSWWREHRRLPASCPCSDLSLLLRFLTKGEVLTPAERLRVQTLLNGPVTDNLSNPAEVCPQIPIAGSASSIDALNTELACALGICEPRIQDENGHRVRYYCNTCGSVHVQVDLSGGYDREFSEVCMHFTCDTCGKRDVFNHADPKPLLDFYEVAVKAHYDHG